MASTVDQPEGMKTEPVSLSVSVVLLSFMPLPNYLAVSNVIVQYIAVSIITTGCRSLIVNAHSDTHNVSICTDLCRAHCQIEETVHHICLGSYSRACVHFCNCRNLEIQILED